MARLPDASMAVLAPNASGTCVFIVLLARQASRTYAVNSVFLAAYASRASVCIAFVAPQASRTCVFITCLSPQTSRTCVCWDATAAAAPGIAAGGRSGAVRRG